MVKILIALLVLSIPVRTKAQSYSTNKPVMPAVVHQPQTDIKAEEPDSGSLKSITYFLFSSTVSVVQYSHNAFFRGIGITETGWRPVSDEFFMEPYGTRLLRPGSSGISYEWNIPIPYWQLTLTISTAKVPPEFGQKK